MLNAFFLFITLMSTCYKQAYSTHLSSLEVGQSLFFHFDKDLTASPKGLARIEWEDHTQNWKVTAKKTGTLILQDSKKTQHIQIIKQENSWVCKIFQCTPSQITGETEDYELFFKAKDNNQNKRLWSVVLNKKGQEKWLYFLENLKPKALSISILPSGHTHIKALPEHIPSLKRALKPSVGFKSIFFFEENSIHHVHIKSKVILITHSNQSSKGLTPSISLKSLRKLQPEVHFKMKNESEHHDSSIIAEPSLLLDLQRPSSVQSYHPAYGWTFTLQTKPVKDAVHKIDISMVFEMKSSHKHYLKTSIHHNHINFHTFLGSIDIHTKSDEHHAFWPFEHIPILAPIVKTSDEKISKQTIEFWICTFSKKTKNLS